MTQGIDTQARQLVEKVSSWYRQNRRDDLPWRVDYSPYRVLVSEMMLQQTQVARVRDYFNRWMTKFPNLNELAIADTASVVKLWQGLGYNRRVLFLHNTAKIVCTQYGGELPNDRKKLEALPGIGPYVAGAIRAFAWNEPEVFIETNIRRVYISEYFSDEDKVSDKTLYQFIANTIEFLEQNNTNPNETFRQWYWALMDYGSVLPKLHKHNANRQSKQYTIQSKFTGSRRQVRGAIIRLLANNGTATTEEVARLSTQYDVIEIVDQLQKEGFIERSDDKWKLKSV